MKFLICDTETTGLSDPIKICEIGWIEIEEDLSVVEEFHSKIDPGIPIEPGASGVHGIRDKHVIGEPSIEKIRFPDGAICLIGHNIKFDYKLVKDHMEVVVMCDTLLLSRRLLPDSPDHKLSTIAAYCDLPETLAHRAIGDCRTVLNLIDYFVEGTGLSLVQLVNYSNTPEKVKVMGWGKHAGTPMSEIPLGYIKWLKSLDDLDIDMKYTLKDFPY